MSTPVPAGEVQARLEALRTRLRARDLPAALLLGNVNRYYFSGTMQDGVMLVPAGADPVFWVRKDARRAAAEAPISVQPLGPMRELAGRIEEYLGCVPSTLGVEVAVLPASNYLRLQKQLGAIGLQDVGADLLQVRSVKSPWEVERMRCSAVPVAEMMGEAAGFLRAGMPELEAAARVEYALRRRGHCGPIRMRGFNQELFYGHLLAGASGAEPSYLDTPGGGRGVDPAFPQSVCRRSLEPGDPVMIDMVGNYGGYLSDQARTFFLGSPDERLRRAVDESIRIHRALTAEARPGVPPAQLYLRAVQLAEEGPFGEHFMGQRQKVKFVGHGIGLELDEFPVLARGFDQPLEVGHTFALEPKFTFDGLGVVGVEDTYVVTEDGLEQITPAPREATIVSAP